MGSVAESVAAKIQSIFELCKLLRFFRERLRDNPTHSENTFFQPPCALALLLCAWRLFRALGGGEVGEVGYMGRSLDVGRWQAPCFGNLVTRQKHYRRCSWSPRALCRKAERIALNFCNIRSIVTAH